METSTVNVLSAHCTPRQSIIENTASQSIEEQRDSQSQSASICIAIKSGPILKQLEPELQSISPLRLFSVHTQFGLIDGLSPRTPAHLRPLIPALTLIPSVHDTASSSAISTISTAQRPLRRRRQSERKWQWLSG